MVIEPDASARHVYGMCEALAEFLRVWEPPVIDRFGAIVIVVESRRPTVRGASGSRASIRKLVHDGVLAHFEGAGLDPEGILHDAVHNRVGVNSGAETPVPVLLGVLGAEHRRGVAVAAFEELQQHASHDLIRGSRIHSSSTSRVKAAYFSRNVVVPCGLSRASAHASASSGIRM